MGIPSHMTLVLVAVDESEQSVAAAHEARQLFGPDASYLAVNVAEQKPTWTIAAPTWGAVYAFPYAAPYPLVESEVATESSQALQAEARSAAADLAHQAGIAAPATRGEVGDPASAILDAALANHADVIVIGMSDKSWWQRLVEGSVGKEVVSRATTPVLIAGRGSGSG